MSNRSRWRQDRRRFLQLGGLAALGLGSADAAEADLQAGLLGHWPLGGDAKDRSVNGHHGRNHGVDLTAAGPFGKPRTAGHFDGRESFVEVADARPLRLGTGDFSIAVWVHTEKERDDVLGDIINKYDPVSRKGFNLSVMSVTVTTSQANHRHIHFGIDNGKLDAQWTDCGRPGKSVYTMGLAVHEGQLFAATCEAGKDEAGHVYRYAGERKWIDCGSPYPCNGVAALASFDGKLYAGVSKYRLRGSALAESPNDTLGGRIFRYEGGKWVDCGQLEGAEAVSSLAVFGGRLYASSMYSPGVFRYEDGEKWKYCGCGPQKRRVEALAVFNGRLYGGCYDGGYVFRYDGGTDWSVVGSFPEVQQTYGFAIWQGKLYVSTWPNSTVFRYDGGDKWTSCGRLGNEKESMGMCVYNGKLYAGTLPLAEVYRYDGGTSWISTGRLDTTPNVTYRRAWSMAVFQGKLFCGTLPSGHIYSLEAGKNVTYDRELTPGWRHIVAVRQGNHLKLFVNGKVVASSTPFRSADYDISNDRPLAIGFGMNDHWKGKLSDVRVYDRALTDLEIRSVARPQ